MPSGQEPGLRLPDDRECSPGLLKALTHLSPGNRCGASRNSTSKGLGGLPNGDLFSCQPGIQQEYSILQRAHSRPREFGLPILKCQVSRKAQRHRRDRAFNTRISPTWPRPVSGPVPSTSRTEHLSLKPWPSPDSLTQHFARFPATLPVRDSLWNFPWLGVCASF